MQRTKLMLIVFVAPVWFVALIGCRDTQTNPVAPAANSTNSTTKITAEPSMAFADSTKAVHVHHQYENGEASDEFTYVESFGGGVATLDFDRDGWKDLFFTGGGKINNNKSFTPIHGSLWRSVQGKRFVNATEASRANQADYYSNGCSAGDLNNDGFPDLMVTGFGGLQLFVNQGDGTFASIPATESGLTDQLWSTSAGFGDLDNDGALDMYVAHNTNWTWENNPHCLSKAGGRDICPPPSFEGLPHVIYMNNQDGTFRPVISEIDVKPNGRGLAVILADLNQDSKLDIYVANDATANYFFLNQGDGNFVEVGVSSGTGLDERGNPNGSMGITVFDIDGNLLPDLWVTNYESETCALYKNDGNANFRCVSSTTGIMALGTLFVGFGTIAGDFDLDGDEDIAIANGHVLRYPAGNSIEQYPLLLRNSGTGKLMRQQFDPSNYFAKKWRGRGVIALDYDADGDLDLVYSHVNQPSVVLENQTQTTGRWCSLELVGTHSNRDCIGTRLVFRTNKKSYLRNIVGGGSYLSQNPYDVHLGIPANEELEQVEITWPNGKKQIVTNLQVNARNQVVEP